MLPKIDLSLLKKYQEEISKRSSSATLKRKTASLSKFFNWAESQGRIQENPLSNQPPITNHQSPITNYKPLLAFISLALGIIAIVLALKNVKLPIPSRQSSAQNETLTQVTPTAQTPQVLSASDWTIFTKLSLSDSSGFPVTTSQTITFKLFKKPEDTTPVWTSKPIQTQPDTEGNISTSLQEVPSDVFFQNDKLFLSGTSQDANGNSQTLPLIQVSTANSPVIPLISSAGNSLQAIAPSDETNIFSNLKIQDVNLKSGGSLIQGYVGNNLSNYDLINLSSGSKSTEKFSVDAQGNTSIAGGLQVAGVTRLNNLGRLGSITGYYQDSGLFEIDQGVPDYARITKTLSSAAGASTADVLTLKLDESTLITGSVYDTLVLKRLGGTTEALALLVDDGNARFDGQIQVGRLATNPEAIGQGVIYYNTADKTVYAWNGTSWFPLGGNLLAGYWQRSGGVISPIVAADDLGLDGKIIFSSDTNLYRSTANTLKTDDSLLVSGSVGIGTTGPDSPLDVLSTSGTQLRLTYTDSSAYSTFNTDSSGNLTIDATGTKTIVADDLQINGADILDTSGDEFLRFSSAVSAINEVTIANAAANGVVTMAATGGDTDIALSIDAKGADALNLNNTGTGDVLIAGGSGSTGCTITNSTGAISCTAGISGEAGSFTTLTSSGASTIGTGASLTNTFGSGASSINTIGSATTPGALILHGATTLDNTFTVSGSNLTALGGNLTVAGDLTITGDNLFMATNTANHFLMADGTNYNPVTPAAARTSLGLDAGGAGDIWVEKAGDTMTGSLTMPAESFVGPSSTTGVYFNSGNVGIGTTSPGYKLDVAGTLNTTGAVTFGSTLGVTGDTTLTGDLAVNGVATYNSDVDFNFTDTENFMVSSTATGTSSVDLISASLANNTSSGNQRMLVLTNSGSGATENGILITNSGTGTTALEISGTWGTGIITSNNSINAGTGAITSGAITSSGILTVSTGGASITGDLSLDGDLSFVGAQKITTTTGDLTLDSSGTLVISDVTDLNNTLDIDSSSLTALTVGDGTNDTLIVDTLGDVVNIQNGGLQTGGVSRLTNAGILENVTGYSQASGTFSLASAQVTGTVFGITENSLTTGTGFSLGSSSLTTGTLTNLSATSNLTNTSSTQTSTLVSLSPTQASTGIGGTHELYGVYVQNLASSGSPSGTNTEYGLRIGTGYDYAAYLESPVYFTNTLTQSGSSQVTLTGNVDATAGLDVSGAALTAAAGLTVSGGATSISGTSVTVNPATGFTAAVNFNGNTILGDSSSDTITFTGAQVSNLLPSTDAAVNLGSASFRYNYVYAANLIADQTIIPNTTSNSFVINSDNITADAEDSQLEYERGATTPNATIKWDSTNDEFNLNYPITAITTETNQLKLGYDTSNYFTANVAANGAVSLDATGAGAAFTFGNHVSLASTTPPNLVLDNTTAGADANSGYLIFRGNEYTDPANTQLDMAQRLVITDASNYKIGFYNNSQSVEIASLNQAGDLTLAGDLTVNGGNINFGGTTAIGDGGDQITLDSNGTLYVADATLTGTGALTLASGTDTDLTLDTGGTGKLIIADATVQFSGSTTFQTDTGVGNSITINNIGSGALNLDLADGGLSTAGTSRLTNGGALQNITGLTVSSGGVGITGGLSSDTLTLSSTATFNGAATFNTDVDMTFAGTENLALTNTVTDTNGVDLVSASLTNNTASGTQRGLVFNFAGTGVTDVGLILTNSGAETATTGIEIAGTWGTGILTNNNSINAGSGSITGGAGNFSSLGLTGPLTVTSSAAPQLSIRYDASNRWDSSVSAAGAVTFDAVGTGSQFSFSDSIDIAGSASSSGTLSFRGTTDPKINILNGENFGIQTSVGGDVELTERMTILNSGSVGIGTTAPASKLEVVGTLTVSGSNLTTLGGNLTVTGTAWTATPTISGLITATSGLTANGALIANAAFTLGDNGDLGSVNTSSWDVSTAGAASGFTGISSSGDIDLSSLSAGGLVKAAATAGRLAIAAGGTDYEYPLTFSNGLTRTANAVKLGGTLTAATDIPLGGYNLTFSGTGNVGIGTTAPSGTLNIVADDASASYHLDTYDSTGNSQQLFRRAQGTVALPTQVLTGNTLGTLGFRGYHSGGAFSTSSRAGLFVYAAEDWTATAQGTYMRFSTTTIGGTSTASRIHIADSGNVGIGTTGPAHKIDVVGTAGLSTGTAWTNTSDIRLKTVEDNLTGSSLDKIMALRPVSFRWNKLHNQKFGSTGNKLNIGFVAQELETILPDMITTDSEGYKWYNPTGFEALLTASIQEQQTQIASISSQLVNLSLTSTGDLNIVAVDSTSEVKYQITNTAGEIIDRVGAFAEVVAADFEAGIAKISELIADKITVTGSLISPVVQTNLISPLADSADVIIKLGETATSGEPELTPEESFGKLIIQNPQGEEVASIDSQGNASFSGELYAKSIVSPDLDKIQELLRQVKEDQDLLAQAASWNTNTATPAGQLDSLTTGQLFVTDQAAISSLSVANIFSVGTDLVIQATGINTLTAPLSLQSLALAPVEIMAGKIRIETNGDVKIAGNVEIAGNLNVKGTLSGKEVTTEKLIIATTPTSGEPELTPEVSSASGIIKSNATAGTAVIPAGLAELEIENSKIENSSLIYVTPTSSTENNVLYVKSKEAGKFAVGFTGPIDVDVSFNWWVVQVQN